VKITVYEGTTKLRSRGDLRTKRPPVHAGMRGTARYLLQSLPTKLRLNGARRTNRDKGLVLAFAEKTSHIMRTPTTLGVFMYNGLPVAKLAVHLVASLGVTKVINDIIKNNTNIATTADAVKVATGSLVLGSMIVEQASDHVNRQWNNVSEWYENRKTENVEEQ
jgi:hypothetical protein